MRRYASTAKKAFFGERITAVRMTANTCKVSAV